MNLRDWVPSDSREHGRDAQDWGNPVEYPSPCWYSPFGGLSPSHCQGVGLSQSGASPPFSAGRKRVHAGGPQPIRGPPPSLGVESTVICYRDPYKLRCVSTSGSVLEFLWKQILQAGAVGSTDRLLGHLSSQGRRLPLGQSGRLL